MKTQGTPLYGKDKSYPGNYIQLAIIRGEINRTCGQPPKRK